MRQDDHPAEGPPEGAPDSRVPASGAPAGATNGGAVVAQSGTTGTPPTVVILLFHAYGNGGTIRSVSDLAEVLARMRDVELVTGLRKWDEALLRLPPGVPVTSLNDRRELPVAARVVVLLSTVPSVLVHPDDDCYSGFTLWTDVLLLRRVRAVRSGVLVTTRPSFNALAAQGARPHVVLVAQQHTHLEVLCGEMPAEIART
jgi:hypothetical protein